MKRLDKRIKIGTKVLIEGINGWGMVSEINHQTWIKVKGLLGSFQRGHILKFTNKGVGL